MRLKLAIQAFIKVFKDPKCLSFKEDSKKESDSSHIRLLAALQRSSRLIDFFKEDISQFSDAQIGIAARKMHAECNKLLEELVTIRPFYKEQEGASVVVSPGYSPHEIKIIGNVKGDPPYKGTLRHKGWCVHKYSLPRELIETDKKMICPAEVEVL